MKTAQTPWNPLFLGEESLMFYILVIEIVPSRHMLTEVFFFFFLLFLEMVSPLYVPERENLVSKKGVCW